MWTPTHHRFADRAAYLAACAAAGWPLSQGEPSPPAGVALDPIGALVAAPTIGEAGAPIPGAVIDARYHVNAAWHAQDVPDAFAASLVTPATPARVFAAAPPSAPAAPPVPASIPAWKGRIVLRETGRLAAVDAAVTAAGGRVLDAWQGAAEWHRDSEFLSGLAGAIGLTDAETDDLFRAADAVRG